jgi:RNA polymerase sigma-70 factor (ECF subfamily)
MCSGKEDFLKKYRSAVTFHFPGSSAGYNHARGMTAEDFQQYIWPYKDRLYRFALRLTAGDMAEAEDVVQEVFVKLWNQAGALSGIANLEAWMLRLTHNLAIDKLRGGYRRRRVDLEEAQLPAAAAPVSDWQDTYEQVRAAMNQLPEAQCAVMHLRDVEGLSYQEICDALDLSMAQVKTNLHRARQRVREMLINK